MVVVVGVGAGAAVAVAVEEVVEEVAVGDLLPLGTGESSLPAIIREWIASAAAPRDDLDGAALCPPLARLLQSNAIYYGSIEAGYLSYDGDGAVREMSLLLQSAIDFGRDKIDSCGSEESAVIWMVDGVPDHAMRSVLDRSFLKVRPETVALGIMIGLFHPYRHRTSRRLPEELTMRSPQPLVAVRRLIRSDYKSFMAEPASLQAFRDAMPTPRSFPLRGDAL